jgi:hypothetical protein
MNQFLSMYSPNRNFVYDSIREKVEELKFFYNRKNINKTEKQKAESLEILSKCESLLDSIGGNR